jgi:hypothetical protein
LSFAQHQSQGLGSILVFVFITVGIFLAVIFSLRPKYSGQNKPGEKRCFFCLTFHCNLDKFWQKLRP